MIEITRETEGAPDFELGLPRTAPLRYEVTWPQEGEAAGLVLVIAGFGDDTSSDYSRNLRRHIVETTGMAAVSVRYHAFHARPTNGGAMRMDPSEQTSLVGMAVLNKARVTDYNNLRALARGLAAVKPDATAKVWIDPADGEYQNFGLMQALDHLCVIGDLIENAPSFDTRRIVALGSSHGGYIAHMIAKIAPATLAAIIDNSSYVQPPMSYLAIGDQPEVHLGFEGLVLHGRVRSAWTVSDRAEPNFYGRDHDLIRDLGFPPHVAAMRAAAADDGARYFMVNAAHDTLSRPEAKRRQHTVLTRAGFTSELSIVGADGIDGRLFKSFTHGLGCSLKGLFDRYIGRVTARRTDPDAVQGSVIAYDCVDRGYRFIHSPVAPYVAAEMYELYETGELAVEAAA